MRHLGGLLLTLVLNGAAPGGAAAAEDRAARIAAAVEQAYRPLLTTYDVPGLAVAVTRDGQSRIFTFGLAAKEEQRPVTAQTLFEIGSVSKTFTATLVASARALGRLSLDDAPGRFLPWLRGTALDRVTLRDLGTYSAGGLPLQFPDGFGAYVAFVPAKRIGLVMLANRNLPIPARITAAHAVLEVLAAEEP